MLITVTFSRGKNCDLDEPGPEPFLIVDIVLAISTTQPKLKESRRYAEEREPGDETESYDLDNLVPRVFHLPALARLWRAVR